MHITGGGKLGLFSLGRRRLRGDTIAIFKYSKGCHLEDGAQLFSVAPEGRARTNGFKLIQKKFRLNIREKFLTVRAVPQWNRLPREVVSAPSLEVLKQRLDSHLTEMLIL